MPRSYSLFAKSADVVYTILLAVFSSVITLGLMTGAAWVAALNIIANIFKEEGPTSIHQRFIHNFKNNLLVGSLTFWFAAALIAAFVLVAMLAYQMGVAVIFVLATFSGIFVLAYYLYFIYILSLYQDQMKILIRNSFQFFTQHLGFALLATLLVVVGVFISIFWHTVGILFVVIVMLMMIAVQNRQAKGISVRQTRRSR